MKSKTENNQNIVRLILFFSFLLILGSTQVLSAQQSMVQSDCEEMTEVVIQDEVIEDNQRETNSDDFDSTQEKKNSSLQQLNPLSYLFPRFENNDFELNLSERLAGFVSRTIEKVLPN